MTLFILFGIIAFAILIFIYLRSNREPKRHSTNTSLNEVLKNAYPNISYKEVYRIGVDNALQLLDGVPCYIRNDTETAALFYQLGIDSIRAVGGNVSLFESEVNQLLAAAFPDMDRAYFMSRVDFYKGIAFGKRIEGLWSFSEIPPSIQSIPMLRCAVAFGDVITNPDMIENYYSAPLLLNDIFEKEEFQKRFTEDFFRLVRTYCVMASGSEFPPPIIKDWEK